MTVKITEDQTTWISDSGIQDDVPFTVYENTDGKKWIVTGNCNACGACEIFEEGYLGQTIQYENKRMVDGQVQLWYRTVVWNDVPGNPGACHELGYDSRKDIPMTPDAINPIEQCSLYGEWINNGD